MILTWGRIKTEYKNRPVPADRCTDGIATWNARVTAGLLAVAVLLAVGVLLRVLQAELVAHLERLAHGPDDAHGLALGRAGQSASLTGLGMGVRLI